MVTMLDDEIIAKNNRELSGQVEPLVMRICDGGLKIIYQNNKPHGIRDKGGFLFFFKDITKYPDQEERYRFEVEQQFKLADYLLAALKDA